MTDRNSVLVPGGGGSHLYEIPVSGGPVRELIRFDGPLFRKGALIAMHDNRVYFTQGEREVDLWAVDLDGGNR